LPVYQMSVVPMKSYVSEEGAAKLRAYKYSGGDGSMIYKYFLAPTAQYLVDNYIPEWLAPNLITALGFLSALISHILVWVMMGDTLSGDYPAWLPLVCALLTFVYSILDNADGKQARKTGSSSALGLLFDHGVDSLMPIVVGINVFAIAQGGNTMISTLGFALASIAFLFPTWEEYYVGALFLPIINGATEGVLILIAVFLASAGLGSAWWTQETFGIPRSSYILLVMAGAALPLIIMSLHKVYHKLEGKGFENALSKLSTSGIIIATILAVTFFSPTNVVARKARFLIYIGGISHGKYMTHMQLSHSTHQDLSQYIYSIWIPHLLLLGNTIIGAVTGQPLVNEDTLINYLVGFVVIAYAVFAVKVVNEVKGALGISAFTIKPKTKKQ